MLINKLLSFPKVESTFYFSDFALTVETNIFSCHARKFSTTKEK